jgi:hypothetical protein
LAHRVADYYANDYKLDSPSDTREKFRRRIEEFTDLKRTHRYEANVRTDTFTPNQTMERTGDRCTLHF